MSDRGKEGRENASLQSVLLVLWCRVIFSYDGEQRAAVKAITSTAATSLSQQRSMRDFLGSTEKERLRCLNRAFRIFTAEKIDSCPNEAVPLHLWAKSESSTTSGVVSQRSSISGETKYHFSHTCTQRRLKDGSSWSWFK